MADLENIEQVLALKKRAAEQKLSAQSRIERALRLEIDALSAEIKSGGGTTPPNAVVCVAELQMQLRWLQGLQSKKADLQEAVRLVRSKIVALQSEFGALSAKHDIIVKQLSVLALNAQREHFALQDQQRLESWQTGKYSTAPQSDQ